MTRPTAPAQQNGQAPVEKLVGFDVVQRLERIEAGQRAHVRKLRNVLLWVVLGLMVWATVIAVIVARPR